MNFINKTSKALTFAVTLSALAGQAFAAGVDVNVDSNDIAIDGYDPVAYFTQAEATEGKEKYTAAYEDAIYHFSSAKNRDLFRANPGKYAPAYGGYCAMGVALDKKLTTDPQAWKIVDGTLYLNLNKDIQKRWSEDIPSNLDAADENWKQIKFLSSDEIAAR